MILKNKKLENFIIFLYLYIKKFQDYLKDNFKYIKKMKVFSFCIYGGDMKYYFGLEENIRLINKFYPDYFIYIYCGSNRLDNFLKELPNKYLNVFLFDTGKEGTINMLYRYKPLVLDNIEYIIIRDSDSEVNERYRWCINDFINKNSNDFVQVIRDNYWHKSRITGGLSFFKIKDIDVLDSLKHEFKTLFEEIENNSHSQYANYGYDENILNSRIFPIIKECILVYSNINVFEGEKYKYIDYLNDGTNFCGNVIEYFIDKNIMLKRYKFNYFDFKDNTFLYQLNWLLKEKQYDILIDFIKEYKYHIIIKDDNLNININYYMLLAYLNKQNIEECMKTYKIFYKYTILDEIKNTVNIFFQIAKNIGYKIIGTCNINYIPKNLEIVIYYGNFPDDYMSLPQSHRIYKHFLFRNDVLLDRFEADDCWKSVDRIFIITLEKEFERFNDTVMQLSFMNAPLDKIIEYRAKKDVGLTDIYIGATKNHLDCLKIMMDNNYKTCLFLEDDFVFTSNIEDNKKKMSLFFERSYDYNICFLSASKYHKREDYDDLLITSKQECTTSSGYFINDSNVNIVYEKVKEGYEKLIKTKNSHLYCIDRYWCALDKIYIFKDKLGFQKPSMSKITDQLNINLD